MKLLTLNLWGGKVYEPLMQFIAAHVPDTDIFCFQDVLFGSRAAFSPLQKARINLFEELQKVLFDFTAFVYRDPAESYIHGELLPLDVGCGQAIFVKKNIHVIENGGFRSHPDSTYHKGGNLVSGRCQWVKIQGGNREEITILNLHGLWQRDTKKKDTPERLEQSQKIMQFFSGHAGKKILCGDFNIVSDGNAMQILEEEMVNLITKYGVTSTRSSLYPKEEQFADYILVSPDVLVEDFQVLPDIVSDHLPVVVWYE